MGEVGKQRTFPLRHGDLSIHEAGVFVYDRWVPGEARIQVTVMPNENGWQVTKLVDPDLPMVVDQYKNQGEAYFQFFNYMTMIDVFPREVFVNYIQSNRRGVVLLGESVRGDSGPV